jgi:hypothetical protein
MVDVPTSTRHVRPQPTQGSYLAQPHGVGRRNPILMKSSLLFTTVALSAALLATSCTSEPRGDTARRELPPMPPRNADAASNTLNGEQPSGTTTGGGQTAPRLNPPHGEPGHVCEIPVGEPLDNAGTGGANAGQTITMGAGANGAQSTITMPQMQAQPAQSTGSGRPNPPHGEPGHVCEIPVGDPLP